MLADALQAEGARVEWNAQPADPQGWVDADEMLAEQMFARPLGARSLRVWRNRHSLVVPRRFAQRGGFADACALIDLPVLTRKSGGTAVVHGPHILNISLAFNAPGAVTFSMAEAYGRLGDILTRVLSSMGVGARLGDVKLAHCPGIYTLQVAGKKLAGTAAFVRRRAGMRVALVHANLALGTLAMDLETIIRFEQALGDAADYAASVHTDLVSALEQAGQ